MMGMLGLLGWKVTVISSNFIALNVNFNYGDEYSYEYKIFTIKKNIPEKNIFELMVKLLIRCFGQFYIQF